MYVRRHRVRNVKLLRDVSIDFLNQDGTPRMWTVFVGENRLCKTTLLQTIAAAACGVDRGTQLVSDVVASWPDLRGPVPSFVDTEFGFSIARHKVREYPGMLMQTFMPPALESTLRLERRRRVFKGGSDYLEIKASPPDPLTEARARGLAEWFVVGYGPRRMLSTPGIPAGQFEPELDRLRPLFGGQSLIGTGFMDLLEPELGRAFLQVLRSVFVDGGLLPHITGIELRGRGGVRTAEHLTEAQRFIMDVQDASGNPIKIPATWLSQGYQALIAWLADVVGQILIETGKALEASEMEGTVLVDEIDLHLHPTWQVRLIPALKAVFPRLQFIATTHSPMVLSGLEAHEIVVLSQDAAGSVVATPSTQSPALLTGSELFSAFFEIRKLYPNELGKKLHRYGYLASDPTRSADEDEELMKLRTELESAGATFDWEPVPREEGA